VTSGPLPKPPDQRARRNKDHRQPRTYDIKPSKQPRLPGRPSDWHERTLAWWDNLRDFPVLQDVTAAEWDYLIETALVHTAFWNGDLDRATELRLRMAKFGVTAEDRARLRISFAVADQAEKRAKAPSKQSKAPAQPYQGLTVVS